MASVTLLPSNALISTSFFRRYLVRDKSSRHKSKILGIDWYLYYKNCENVPTLKVSNFRRLTVPTCLVCQENNLFLGVPNKAFLGSQYSYQHFQMVPIVTYGTVPYLLNSYQHRQVWYLTVPSKLTRAKKIRSYPHIQTCTKMIYINTVV